MKLQQLRYIWEVAHHNLNVSATAQSLYTSQPGISKQIRLLEDELGVEVFSRSGKHLTRVTPAGEKIVEKAGNILQIASSIKQVAQEFTNENTGRFSIATSHTQARYLLPNILSSFVEKYPDVLLSMHQGTSGQIIELAADGHSDLAIISDYVEISNNNLIMLPCYQWRRSILVPKNHPLTRLEQVTLEELSKFPVIGYVSGFGRNNNLGNIFKEQDIALKIVLTATDTEVVKTYVRKGLGIGIIAEMAFDQQRDNDLTCLSASHFLKNGIAQIGLKKESFLRSFMYDFIQNIAPHLTNEVLNKAMSCQGKTEMNLFLDNLDVPER